MGIKYFKYVFVVFCIGLVSCKKQQTYFLTQGEIFRTSYHIKYKYHKELGKEIQTELDRFNLSLNPFNKQSVIYKVNNNEEVEVDDWFMTVFNKAKEVSEISHGAYDITCAPLINAWGFGFSKMDSVNHHIIDSLKQFVGFEKVRLHNRKIIKDDPRIQLSASSIAKGYSCDVIAELLDSYEISDYMIEIGGEVRGKGKNPNNECWKIEITKPHDDSSGQLKERLEVVKLCDYSLATSGNYRNYYIKDGKKYAHTMDPQTGYPAENSILSATVITPDCITADAFATAFMTLGLEESCLIGDKIPNLEYIFVYTDEEGNMKEKMSSNINNFLVK